MKTDTVKAILFALLSLDRGDASISGLRLSEVVFWSNVPRSTAFRYLKKMETCKLVCRRIVKYRNEDCSLWIIDHEGIKYVAPKF